MKNDKCIIVALLGFVVIGMQIKKQDVKLASASTYPYGVGFCIDITKDSYSGNNFIVGAPIYKDTFFNSSPYNFVSQNKSLYYEAYGESLLDYSLNYQTGYNIDFGLNTNLPGFSMDMKNGFSHNISIADSSVSNQFYYKRSYESYKYNVSLKNKAYLHQYDSYFTDEFLYDLQQLVNETMDYEDFFDRYGTHLITSAKYGGSYASYFSFSSEEVTFTNEITQELIAAAKGTLSSYGYGGIGAKLSASSNTTIKTAYNSSQLNASFYIESCGGQSFSATNGNYDSAYLSWIASIDSNNYEPVIIGYENDSLVPLFDVVPSAYQSIKTEMESQLELYIKKSFVDAQVSMSSNSIVLESNIIRAEETSNPIVEKSDSKILQNQYDIVYFSDLISNPYDYYSYGYTQLAFIVSLDVSEDNDGRQYVCIFPNDLSSTSPLKKTVFDHTPNSKDATWYNHIVKVDSVPMSSFASNQSFIIGYTASGYMDDDWNNCNIVIKLVVSKLSIHY